MYLLISMYTWIWVADFTSVCICIASTHLQLHWGYRLHEYNLSCACVNCLILPKLWLAHAHMFCSYLHIYDAYDYGPTLHNLGLFMLYLFCLFLLIFVCICLGLMFHVCGLPMPYLFYPYYSYDLFCPYCSLPMYMLALHIYICNLVQL